VTAKNDEKKKEAVEVFFDVLRAMVRIEIGDNPSLSEEKEAIYIMNYIQGIVTNAIGYWRDYKRIPLFKFELYGDHRGTSLVDMYMSPDAQMMHQFMLRELAYKLKEASDKWEIEWQARDIPVPELGMGKVTAELSAFQAIRDHIKKKGE
jgi:hypothetical protein